MKKEIKIPLWSFDRKEHQWDGFLRNRYVLELSTDPSFSIFHEVLTENGWRMGYSWFDLSFCGNLRKEDEPDKEFLFGLLKRYDDYYDGSIITWTFGRVSLNYRW